MELKLLGLLLLAVISLAGSQNAYDDWNYDYRYDLYDYEEHENGETESEKTDHVITHYERPEDPQPPVHREHEEHPDDRYEEPPVYSDTGHETLVEDQDSVCARTCKASNESGPGIRYLPGHQYRYQYEGQVVSRARAAGSAESRMSVRAYVMITANTPCDLKMQVMGLSVDDIPPGDSAWFRDAVERHDLHFSYQDGEIEYLCPHEDEDAAATNFKRGILSALQVSVINVDDAFEVVLQEADVAGECETRYQVTTMNDLVVNKTKENCRSNAHLPYLPYAHYTTDRINSELPFFRRDQSCQMFRSESAWERVECVEEVRVEGPFPSLLEQSALASLTVTSSLHLQAGPEEAPGPFYEGEYLKRRESLRMDLKGAVDSSETRHHVDSAVRDQIDVTLEYLAATVIPDSGLEEGRPHAFSNLVNLLGRLRTEGDLDNLWEANWQRDNYKEFLLDALLLCDGPHCFRLVTHLAEDPNNLFDSRLRAWLAGIHFHANTDPESVQYLMELARTKPSMEDEIVMAASSIVHRLCLQDREDECQGAKPFLEYVQEKIGSKCGYGEDRQRQNKVKVMLRALGNAGVLPYEGFPDMCYLNKMHNSELRVAALQTYRRSGCPATEAPWKILEDSQDDVEVRLAAYLAMVPCATETPGFFTRIHQLLEREEVNQVGSFIWTHVRNLAEQPGPGSSEQELSKLAAQHALNAKFNTNAFRSSRNYRYAQFSQLINMGGSVDSDVIFTPESYLPRHASVNFTLDFLDKSFNVFEVGGDFSGMEDYIERLFGEGGYFENPEIQGLVENLRPKREVQDERIEEFQRMYNDARTLTEEADPEAQEPKASVFFRIFGNEVFYMENLLQANPLQALRDMLREFSVPRSFQLLNQEYVSPTLLGFPLRLRVNSTGSINFDREGTFETTDDGNLLISGRLNPTAVLATDETLMVDGYGSASGIRRRTTQVAHASIGGRIEVKDGQVVDIRIDTYNADVAKLSSSVNVLLYNNYKQVWEGQQNGAAFEEVESCSPEMVNNILGLEFCNTWRYTIQADEENTVITEPHAMELTVSKADNFDHYQFSYTRKRNMFEILFDTPGSSVDRKVNLNINLKSNHARGTLTIPGSRFDVEGQYEYTSEIKKLALKYSRDTTLRGEMEVSLQTAKEIDNVKYSPKFMMTITDFFDINTSGSLLTGPNNFMLEGSIMSSFQDEAAAFKALWSREGSQNKIEGQFSTGQSYASTSGTINTDPGHTMVQLSCEYGASRSSPYSLSLSLDSTSTQTAEGSSHTGSLVLESSQAEVSMNMDYDYRPGYVDTNATITVRGTEMTSHVGLKNVAEGNERDFLVTLSCTSQDLNIDYLLKAVYKKSDNAFLAESEVNLGSFITSKASLTYLFESDPLHLLAGLHLQFNDFVMQASHTLDFSQSNRVVILLTGTVGPASAGFHFEGEYDPSSPFNASLDVFGTYDSQRAGVAFSAESDQAWRTFSGNVRLHWFDWTYIVAHSTTWEENKKEIVFTSDRHGILQLTAETSPNLQLLRLVTKSDSQAADSDFEMAMLNQEGPDRQQYEVYITSMKDKLFHLTVTLDSAQTFSSSLRLLESKLQVRGHYDHPDADHLKTAVQMTFTQPSGETFTSDLHLSHAYDGSVRDIKASSTYNGDVIEGLVKITNRDGWFSDDSRGLAFTFTTPFNRLRRVGFAFEAHGNPAAGGFAEFEWDELKIRGESQMSDDIEVKLQYEDGGTCDSHLHLYHKYDGEHYMTGASLALTPSYDPWKIELITTKAQEVAGDFVSLELNLNSPINTAPFQIQGLYKFTDDEIDLELQAGTESDKTSLSFSGKNELDWGARRLTGSLEFNSPWVQPVTVNVTNIHDEEYFNVTFDLRSSLKYINTIAAEFSANYAVPEETKAHFYLSHKDVQATMEMNHKFSEAGLKQHLHASVNTMSVSYESEAAWGEDLVPQSANGRITLTDIFGQNMDLSLRHSKEAERFVSQLFGTWNVHTFHFDHTLDYHRSLEWTSNSQLTIPNYEDPITLQLVLNAQEDLSTLDSNLHLTTPWTEDFIAKLYFDFSDPSVPSYRFDSLYGDATVFNIEAEQYAPFAWEHVDVKLKMKSQYFEDVEIRWKHNFESNTHIYLNTTYGSQYHIQGESNLQFEESYFGTGAFVMYNFTAKADLLDQEVHFQTGLSFDSQYRGDLEVTWGEYILFFKTDVPDGIVFKVLVGDPEGDYVAELTHLKGSSDIPNLRFRLSRNNSDIFLLKSEIENYYPHFEGMFVASYYPDNDSPQHTEMKVLADMSDLEDYGFKGNFKINSDFEGFENLMGELDFDLTIEDSYLAGHLTNQFDFNEWHFNSKVNCSLNLDRQFQFEYQSEYDLSVEGELYDMKELSFLLSINSEVVQTKFNLKYSPKASEWSFFCYYHQDDMDFKGYIIPGNARKYELAAKVANSTLNLDAQRTDEFGSRFIGLKGNINWSVKKFKKQFTVNMNSDIPEIKKITLHVFIQQRRGFMATAKLKVNQENFVGSVRYMSRKGGETGRITIKMENEIFYPFDTETTIQYSIAPDDYRANIVTNLNEKKWASLDMKASLKESYLKIESPFPVIENVDIKVNLLTEEDFGLTVTATGTKFCFNLESSLSRTFTSGELKANYQAECSEPSLFDLSAKYEYPSETFEVHLHIQDIVSFDVSSIRDQHERVFKAEVTISAGPSYGVLISSGFDFNYFQVKLCLYSPSSDSNYFLFTFFVSKTRFEIGVETTRKIFHTEFTYNLQLQQFMLEGKYFSDFFEPFSSELHIKGHIDSDMGEAEVSLLSDDNTVNSEFIMNYDLLKEPKTGNFKLTSPKGDAEGHADFTITDGYISVTGEMLSTLHSFHEYTFKFEGNLNDDHPQFQLLITQDNNTYEVTGDQLMVNEMMKSKLFVSTPFHGYEHFEFSYGTPVSDSEQRTYHAGLNMTISGDSYGVDIAHNHHTTWSDQDTEISIFTPRKIIDAFKFAFMYNIEGEASVSFDHARGRLGLAGSFRPSDTNISLEILPDLTFFDAGEYIFMANIPLVMDEGGEIRLERRQTDFDFVANMSLAKRFKSGQIVVKIIEGNAEESNASYSLSFVLKNPRNIQVDGFFENWEMRSAIKLRGKKTAASTGNITVTTNIPGYEDMEAGWDIGKKKMSYFMNLRLDMKENGNMDFKGKVDNQSLDIQFTSTFTKDHHVIAEYQMNPLILKATYQYGLDKFEIDFDSQFDPREGMMKLIASLPFPYVSKLQIGMKYSFFDNYDLNINAAIEHILFECGFNLASDGSNGDFILNLITPFSNPTKVKISWSVDGTPLKFEAFYIYGHERGGLKLDLEYTNTTVDMNINVMTPFDGASEITFNFKYDGIGPGPTEASIDLSVDYHNIKISTSFEEGNNSMEIISSASLDFFGFQGQFELTFNRNGLENNLHLQGDLKEYDLVDFSFNLNEGSIQSDLKYGNVNIFVAKFEFYSISIQSAWSESHYFNFDGKYESTDDGHQLELSIESSEMQPIAVQASYSGAKGHEGNVSISHGDKQYDLSGNTVIQKKKSGFELHFTSSEDPYHPFNMEAQYNINAFAKGNMGAMEDLAGIMLEWGDKIDVSVTGMRKGDRAKVVVEIITPFKALPRLSFGFDAEFSLKRNLTQLTLTTFAEWTQKITLSGFFKSKKNELVFNCSLNTPFTEVQKLSANFTWKPNQVEASFIHNEDEWKITGNYEFTQTYSVQVTAQTPLKDFDLITFNVTTGVQDNKFVLTAEMTWPEENNIHFELEAQVWKMEMKFNSPWMPFQEVIFEMSLQTESEDGKFSAKLEWDNHNFVMTAILSPMRSQFNAKFQRENSDIFGATFEYNFGEGEFRFDGEVTTPVAPFEKLEAKLHWSSVSGKFVIYVADFEWTLEAQNDWRNLNSYMSIPHSSNEQPLNIIFKYEVQPDEYKFSSVFEVSLKESSEKWVLIDIKFEDPWTIKSSIFNTNVEVEVTKPNRRKFNVHLHIESQEMGLESVLIDAAINHKQNFKIFSITSTMSVKPVHGEATKHELIMDYEIISNHFSMKAEIHSDYIDVPYGFICKIPLILAFGPGTFNFAVTREGEQVYKVSFDTLYPDDETETRILKIKSPEWSVTLTVSYSIDSFSFALSYPDSATEHTLQINWNEDISFEKVVFSLEMNSPYLKENTFLLEVNFNVRALFSFVINGKATLGLKQLDFTGQFQYNRQQQQVQFDAHVSSDWTGKHSLNYNIQWQREIIFTADLKVDGEDHKAKLTIDSTTYTMRMTVNSSWLPHKDIVIIGKVNEDFTPSNIQVEGKVTSAGDTLLEGNFENHGFQMIKSEVRVKNKWEVFQSRFEFENSDNKVYLNWYMSSILPELNANFKIQYDESDVMRGLRVNGKNYLTGTFSLRIDNSKTWYKRQEVSVRMASHSLSLVSIHGGNGNRVTVTYDKYNMFIHYNFSNEIKLSVSFSTPLPSFKNAKLYFSWPQERSEKELDISYATEDDEYEFHMSIMPDPIIGWACKISVITPYKGYEKFVIQTPQFGENMPDFAVMFEYPGGKVGAEIKYYMRRWSWCDLRLSLNLPLEKYEIVSLKYIMGMRDNIATVEGRIGKVGFTYSLKTFASPSYDGLVSVVRVNEITLQTIIRLNSKKDALDLRTHTEMQTENEADLKWLDTRLLINLDRKIYFQVESHEEELLKLHIEWGSDRIFAITTSKNFPAFLVLNFENSEMVNECRVKVGVSSGMDIDSYGFHFRQEALEGGHHISLSGDSAENNFYAEGTFSVNYHHLNESLVFELNKNRIGYRSNFQIYPGILTDEYRGAVELMLPAQTVHWNTSALCGSGDFDLQSRFTWNDLDQEVPAVNLIVKYDDKSHFGQEEHHIMAVFSHPEIKNIVLQGNITQSEDTTLSALVELIDENVPERNVILAVDIHPYTENRTRDINATITQSFSGFAVNMDAQITDSNFHDGIYEFKYWSLTKETWENLHVSTRVEPSMDGFDFEARVKAPKGNWGYTYRGNAFSNDHEAAVTIMGISDRYGDFWEIETTVSKHLPEFTVHLDIGQENEEAYEKGRLRIGLHNPLEIGAALDHRKFGEWRQDGAIGLRLKTEDILQFVLEFDPSLDYQNEHFLVDLVSPADQIFSSWGRDLEYTTSAFAKWFMEESPSMYQVLVNNPTVVRVWNAEMHHFQEFVSEMNGVITDIHNDGQQIWNTVIQPSLNAVRETFNEMREQLERAWEAAASYMNYEFSNIRNLGQEMIQDVERWQRKMEYELTKLSYEFSSWWDSMTHRVAAQYNNLMYHFARALNSLANAWYENWVAVERAAQPYVDSLVQAFTRYGVELDAIFGGQCYKRIVQVFDETVTTLQQEVSWMNEFLQTEEYYSRFLQAKETLASWARGAVAVIEGGLQNLQTSVQESPLVENFREFQRQTENMIAEMKAEGTFHYFEQKISELGNKIKNVYDEAINLLKENLHTFRLYAEGNIIFDYINAAAGNVYERMVWTWERWNQEERHDLEKFERIVLAVIDGLQTLLLDNNFFVDESIVFEPAVHGRIEYNQHLPVPWTSFLEYPQWHRFTNVFRQESPVRKAERLLNKEGFEMASGWWALSHLGALRPPFSATGTVIGQHVTTFDLRHYQFLGSCSYLLAKDFVGGDFEVIGEYESVGGLMRLKSVVVRGQGTDVTLHVDGTVEERSVAGQVLSGGEYSAVAFGGLFVTCSKNTQGCSVTVSGKYFGRLAGLLGNYNNEPADDWRGPDGTEASASTWSVSPEACYEANQAIRVNELREAEEGVEECSRIFLDSDSRFSNCFEAVDPRPYFWHCVNSFNRPEFDLANANTVCNVASAYRTQCLNQKISLPSLMECAEVEPAVFLEKPVRPMAESLVPTCDAGGEEVPLGWSQQYEAVSKGSADVALVIELAACHKGKDMQKLFKLFKVQMKKAGAQDVQYALVTTAGRDSNVSSFMTGDEIESQLSGLSFEGAKSADKGYSAVLAAAKELKWRPGVSRTILHLSCQPCDMGENLEQVLKEHDVTYHIVTKIKINVEGPSEKRSKVMASKVFGFDEKFVYTVGDFATFRGNTKIRAMMQQPEGVCVAAAEGSGGSVFNGNKWVTSKALLEKKFLRVMAQRVSMSTSAPECQECQCTGSSRGTVVKCYECSEAPDMSEMSPLDFITPSASKSGGDMDAEDEIENAIVEDIRKDFKEQFIEENVALETFTDEAYSDESESAEDYSEEEEEEEEDYEVEANGGENYDYYEY